MKYTLEYPSELPSAPDDFLRPEVIREVAIHAESSGFSALALSEHPAPSMKWRRGGGHNTLDPIAALSFMAAVTDSIALMTNLYVLPFRNPYLSAKALGSVEIVSGGRLIAGVGAGYLRSEFAAVGVDFDRRAELLDEALDALQSIWTRPQVPFAGKDFEAQGPLWLQNPIQQPHPPIWIGGNGNAAMRRVVEHGSGWMPIIASAGLASAIRTVAIEDADQFEAAVGRLRTRLLAVGRDPSSVDVQVVCPHIDLDDHASLSEARTFVNDMERRGATSVVVHVDGSSPQAATNFIKVFGEAVIDG
ncbi:TIGR03619 family F420-dependent LLM class oxidoreductase [Williamsia sp.]|uniref:TIGR03619 family F420-dependent LLM class oxidoreductase n=1 Tax=Williamsia sp. TaxID=1872085 RepID=UPI002F93EA01